MNPGHEKSLAHWLLIASALLAVLWLGVAAEHAWSIRHLGAALASLLLVLACLVAYLSQRAAAPIAANVSNVPSLLLASSGVDARFILGPADGVSNFLVADCNEAARTWLAPRACVGVEFASLFPQFNRSQIDDFLRSAVSAGFADIELKGGPSKSGDAWLGLIAAVSQGRLVLTARDISSLKNAESQLKSLALNDALTSLPNRHWLTQQLPDRLEQARQRKQSIGLLFLDLDDFKIVNDSFGHAAGDDYLRAVAAALKSAMRAGDVAGRLAGDEFTVLLASPCDLGTLEEIGHKVVDRIRAIDCEASRRGFVPRASVGGALFPVHAHDASELMHAADTAMYEAKGSGKGRVCIFSAALEQSAKERVALHADLRSALAHDEFFLLYQPRVSAKTGLPVGLSAKLRWKHPRQGVISPARHIGLVEQSSLVEEIGEAMVMQACRQLAAWRAAGFAEGTLLVSLFAAQLRNANLRTYLSGALQKYELPAHALAFEVPANVLDMRGDAAERELAALGAMGVRLVIGGVGGANLSLVHLKDINVHAIRLSRSLVRAIAPGAQVNSLAEAVIQLSRNFGFAVFADGVDSSVQLLELQLMRCDEVQGKYIAPPIDAATMPSVYARRGYFEPVFPTVQRVISTR